MPKFLFFIFFIFSIKAYTQELNCEVQVLFDPSLTITTLDKEVAKELEVSIQDFMNTTKWSSDKFDPEERINCLVSFKVIKILTKNTFEGELQVQSTRPIYNSTYNSVLFNTLDKDCSFRYQRNAVLQYNENEFRDNLTSILAYYAYMILGYDYDSFSLKGGDKFFNKAQNIVSTAQGVGGPGWNADQKNGRRNRYYLIQNALQELFSPLRKCFYDYHINGMDQMISDTEKARSEIIKSIESLKTIHSAQPGSFNVTVFLNGKLNELVNLFSQSTSMEKTKILNLLKKIDPSNANRYQKIMEF